VVERSWRFPMRVIGVFVVIAAASFLAGCVDTAAQDANAAKVVALEATVKELETKIEALESARRVEEFERGFDSIAYMTPGAEGYNVIRTDLGYLTVQLQNVEPYANGSRVTLRIGNVTGATINGAKAKIEWGSVDDKGSPQNDQAKSRDVEFSRSLRAGAWTNVPVVLEGVPATQLGFVRVKDVTHTGISLAS
jgi:outer membrane murein-binding lipoprotein Lpp